MRCLLHQVKQTRKFLDLNVFEKSVERMKVLYEQGHRIVVSFSGGKDSGVCLEICIIAATMTGRLPVEVVMRDEEIMFPGTFEYCEWVASRPEVSFHWLVARQPVLNVFNRARPYFWVFDPQVPEDEWVRPMSDRTEIISEMSIDRMTIPERFPPPPGKELMAVVGLRTSESRARLYGLYSSRGYITKPNRYGVRGVRPIYDYQDGDIWKVHADYGWRYNTAYDVMFKMGTPKTLLRIAPPTMNVMAVKSLTIAAHAWPRWFDKVCERLPGVRLASNFGRKAVEPTHRRGEPWEETYQRECIDTAPDWIAERAARYRTSLLRAHRRHSAKPFPDVAPCRTCAANNGSWKRLSINLYSGDPFSMKADSLPIVEPEFFREGGGKWGGKPSF